jgi:glycogen phosphorylase
LGNFYLDPAAWDRAAVLNVASSGKFSSDSTIAQYAAQIWNVTACPTVEDLRAAESVA